MSALRHPADIHLWTGDFASQQLAFAHLLDAADRAGAALNLDDVEVIAEGDRARRLAPYFDTLPDLPSAPITILLATPPGVPCPIGDTPMLRYLGCHAGFVTRAGAAWA